MGEIHADAFRASQHSAETVYVNNYRLARSNLTFLHNFTALQNIHLFNMNLKGFQPTTFLPSVRYIQLLNCAGIFKWPFPISLTPNLKTVDVNLDFGSDDAIFTEKFAGSVPSNVSLTFV